MAGLIAAGVACHTPRIGVEDKAPPFVRGIIDGEREMGQAIKALQPDVIVVNSAHWVSTFVWFTDGMDPHQGVCVAHEAPDLIPGTRYSRKGDPALAEEMVRLFKAKDLPSDIVKSPDFAWDYGALVPLLYLDGAAELPVVQVPTCLSADLAESQMMGDLVDQAARATGRRAVFIASCALSHDVVRGPEKWPTQERMEMDRRFIDLACQGDVDTLEDWFPTYSRDAKAEMGGRNLAAFLGAAKALGRNGGLEGRQYGPYAQSSGSGNANLLLTLRH